MRLGIAYSDGNSFTERDANGYTDGHTYTHAYTYDDCHSHRNAVSDANLRTGRTDNNTLRLE